MLQWYEVCDSRLRSSVFQGWNGENVYGSMAACLHRHSCSFIQFQLQQYRIFQSSC